MATPSSFLQPEAQRAAREAVRSIEARSSAEVKVVVRQRSGDYRAADLLAGAGLSFAVLCVLLFHPRPFAVATMPLDVLVCFALGALLSSRGTRMRRALTPSWRRREQVRVAARSLFVELDVSRTRARTGVLVYVSLLERAVEVVADRGVDVKSLGAEWDARVADLEAALTPRPDAARFRDALAALGPVLARVAPPRDDDDNELPDEVDAA